MVVLGYFRSRRRAVPGLLKQPSIETIISEVQRKKEELDRVCTQLDLLGQYLPQQRQALVVKKLLGNGANGLG